MNHACLALIALVCGIVGAVALSAAPKDLKGPVEEGIWIRPSNEQPAEPIIGFKDGIRIGLWPTGGPRGLIRIFTPYVFPAGQRSLINFIAVEPIVSGGRGYSEMERSALDGVQGKRFWFADDLSRPPAPAQPWETVRGKLGRFRAEGKEIETLSIVVDMEKLDNGAHPRVMVTFRADRPNEIGLRVYSAKDGEPMESCVLTATMGNYSRARKLWLRDEIVESNRVWPDYEGHDFLGHDQYRSDRLLRLTDGSLIAAVTPNESDLAAVEVSPGWWAFKGKVATQYWRKYPSDAQPDLRVNVNGRARYFGTNTLIPGGVSFENFELIESFKPGLETWFGVTLKTPNELGWKTEARHQPQ